MNSAAINNRFIVSPHPGNRVQRISAGDDTISMLALMVLSYEL